MCTPFFSASLVKLMEGPPVYASKLGAFGGATQYRYSQIVSVGYVHNLATRGTGDELNHSAAISLPPTMYMYLPWTWPPLPYRKGDDPFLYLDY